MIVQVIYLHYAALLCLQSERSNAATPGFEFRPCAKWYFYKYGAKPADHHSSTYADAVQEAQRCLVGHSGCVRIYFCGTSYKLCGSCKFSIQNSRSKHVRKRVENEEIIESLYTDSKGEEGGATKKAGRERIPDKKICANDRWGILFRLGKLEELQAPPPLDGSDDYFRSMFKFICFDKFFASNLDKFIAMGLGSVAISIVWIGLVDNLHYHEVEIGNAGRIIFLTSVVFGYWTLISLCLAAFTTHISCWSWGLAKNTKRHKAIQIAAIAVIISAFLLVNLMSLDLGFYTFVSWVRRAATEREAFLLLEYILLLSIFIPMALLILGDILTRKMIIEADKAIEKLLVLIADRPKDATLGPAVTLARNNLSDDEEE